MRVDVAECHLSEHAEIALFRIAQESLQNIVKHAKATRAHIELHCDAEHAVLRVTDNGCGFSRAADSADGSRDRAGESSYGLRHMAEREELMGGRLEVTSRAGLGTTVTAVIPAGTATGRKYGATF